MQQNVSAVQEWAEWIQRKIKQPRDVRAIWSRLAPELAYGRHLVPAPPDARRAAVLVLLYPVDGEWRLPLIERIEDATVHSGQVSLPGGAMDPHESPEQTAVREFEEELGVSAADVVLCGQLTPTYIYASNFLVVPCVAVTSHRPTFQPNPDEVARVLEMPVRELRNPDRLQEHQIHRRGVTFRAPHIQLGEHRVWGATSMILAELTDVLP